ncbi:hypothetical protein GOP47_0026600 [Adiantum capillus-veneris]|nr:hypothetical protein GOP47_0026600 [Adiantum capillus-veneris]
MTQNAKKDEKEKEKEKERKVVLQAKMDCNSCRYKVYKAIVGYPGVEDINIDMKAQKVTLKVGKDVDPFKLFAVLYNKSNSKITCLLAHPPPAAPPEKKKEPEDVTVVLKAHMHCDACRKKLMEIAWCVGDVYSVHLEADKVTIKGKSLDPKKVCADVTKRYRKHVELVVTKKQEPNKKTDEKSKEQPKKVIGPLVYPPQYFSNENTDCAIM